ncbi:exopolysaccharide transport family protein [Roseibium aggregatum]|uniref:Succinoglycan transporter n=1 Tax=Roseibium aggregatum TaxID=187304 RepID=A0A939EC60_9HYPH|nr:exopolysaccharide transport family protein [Roseibium aggregatum]MBN9669892.1 succinoglycan transporter [Roseibium aggregatum]
MQSDRQALSEDDMALDLGGLLRAIGRSLTWLLPLTLLVAGAVFIGLQFVPPKYKGEARILIQSTDTKFPGEARGVEEERALLDSEGVASQAQLLMSSDLARRVARKLDLAAIPEFGARDDASLLGSLLSMVGLGGEPEGGSAEDRVLKHYYQNLDIYRLEGSRVIAIDYSAENPVLAAKVANTIVDEYLSLQSDSKRQSTELASAALQPQIVELRKEVQAARQAVADFRARSDLLIGSGNTTLNQQQLTETSSDYSAAQADKAEAQAKADLIRELLNSGGSLETASEVLNSTLIQRLRERQVEIQSTIAELSITLLPNHPQLKALQSQLRDYDRQIRTEARRILQGLENDAKVANQQALALEKRLEDLKTAAARSNADQARLSELEREANAKAVQLDQLLQSYQEADTRLRAQILPADARIISQASVPAEPYAPKVISSTIIAGLVTFILGCTFVLMRAFLSGNALYSLNGAGVAEDGQIRAYGAPDHVRGPTAPPSGIGETLHPQTPVSSASFGWGGGYGESVSNYRMETAPENDFPGGLPETPREPESPMAGGPAQTERFAPEDAGDTRDGEDMAGRIRAARYDRDFAPDWLRGSAGSRMEEPGEEVFEAVPAPAAAAADETQPEDEEAGAGLQAASADTVAAEGRIVVLSVDDEALSHDLAFDLVRRAARSGKSALILEVFPEQSNPKAAEGFSDIVSGRAPFAKVVYRDAGSKAHIIEAGRVAITDEMVNSDRFKLALDAVKSTYETVVVDLGAIDGTLASARMLSFADRVLIAANSADSSHELHSAANLLSYNTGARVDVVISGGQGPDPRRNGDGHAA